MITEHGIVIPLGRALFARRLPAILEDAENGLSPRLVAVLHRLRQRWLAIDVEVEQATKDLVEWAEQSDLRRRAATVPGIGPMIATAVVAAVVDGRMFSRGRGMAAWLGLVPRQHTTGGEPMLGGISKRGNTHLRQLFIQGANALYLHMKRDRLYLGDGFDRSRTQPPECRRGRPRQQDGPDLLEGPDERAGVRAVSGPRLLSTNSSSNCEGVSM